MVEILKVDKFGEIENPFFCVEVSWTRTLVIRLWEVTNDFANPEEPPLSMEGDFEPLGPSDSRYLELQFNNVGVIEITDEFLERKDWVFPKSDWPKTASAVMRQDVPYPIVCLRGSLWRNRFDDRNPNYSAMKHLCILSMDFVVDVLTEELPLGIWRSLRSTENLN
jgi:hypothetical protein